MKTICIAILASFPMQLPAQVGGSGASGGTVRIGATGVGPASTLTTANLRIQTQADPPSSPLARRFASSFNSTGSLQGRPSFLSRRLLDHTNHVYFGYELLLEEQQPGTYMATFGKLGITPLEIGASMSGWVSSGVANGSVQPATEWTMQDLPEIPKPRPVQPGDKLIIVLFQDALTGDKLFDEIEIHPQPQMVTPARISVSNLRGTGGSPTVPTVTGPARDYSVGDAEMRIAQPRITLNGEPATSSAFRPSRGAIGALVWIYLPGKGRYILSLAPRPELHFVKAGEVRGGSASFTAGADKVDKILIECSNEIVPARSAYNLYVLADPQWEPISQSQKSQIEMGSVDPGELAKLQ